MNKLASKFTKKKAPTPEPKLSGLAKWEILAEQEKQKQQAESEAADKKGKEKKGKEASPKKKEKPKLPKKGKKDSLSVLSKKKKKNDTTKENSNLFVSSEENTKKGNRSDCEDAKGGDQLKSNSIEKKRNGSTGDKPKVSEDSSPTSGKQKDINGGTTTRAPLVSSPKGLAQPTG